MPPKQSKQWAKLPSLRQARQLMLATADDHKCWGQAANQLAIAVKKLPSTERELRADTLADQSICVLQAAAIPGQRNAWEPAALAESLALAVAATREHAFWLKGYSAQGGALEALRRFGDAEGVRTMLSLLLMLLLMPGCS